MARSKKKTEEVVCVVPFSPKKASAYNFLVHGKLVVLEDGVPRLRTKITADPRSHYRLQGRKVIRTFVPGAAEKRARAQAAHKKVLASPALKALVASWAKGTRRKPERTTFETTGEDGEIEGYLVRDRGLPLDKVRAEAAAVGALAFRTTLPGDSHAYLGVVPGDDPLALCDLVVNIGNVGLEPHELQATLRAVAKQAPVTIEAVTYDTLEARLGKAPKDAAKLGARIERLGADSIGSGDGARMLKKRSLFLWWD